MVFPEPKTKVRHQTQCSGPWPPCPYAVVEVGVPGPGERKKGCGDEGTSRPRVSVCGTGPGYPRTPMEFSLYRRGYDRGSRQTPTVPSVSGKIQDCDFRPPPSFACPRHSAVLLCTTESR